MTSIIKLLAVVAGAVLVLMLAAGLIAKALLSPPRIEAFIAAMSSDLPVKVTASEGTFNLRQWLMLRPAITLREVSIANPEGFSPGALAQVREVSAQVAMWPLLRRQVYVRSFTLIEPDVGLESNRKGESNLAVLFAAMGEPERAPEAEVPERTERAEWVVDRFLLRSGTLRVRTPDTKEPLELRDIDVTLQDFAADKTCRMSLQARLFGGRRSRVEFDGNAGPFGGEALPARGALALELASAEIPSELRARYLGDLLREPGEQSRITVEASLEGDLFKELHGEGRVALSDFQLGKDRDHLLPLLGEAPLALTIGRPLSAPSLTARAREATLQLGQGRWKGGLELRFGGQRFRGSSTGSVSDVDINALLSAFTSAEDKVFGRAAISEYNVRWDGASANEIQNSLTGRGRISVEEGRVALFDLVATIERRLRQIVSGEEPAAGDTEFIRLGSSFEIGGQRLTLSDLNLEGPGSRVTGQGHVTFNQELQLDLVTNLEGKLAASLRQEQLRVPVRVRGTVDSPRVQPDVGRLVTDRVKGLLERFR
jgi:uncharacterized protein involved in outer membrane biogenesis